MSNEEPQPPDYVKEGPCCQEKAKSPSPAAPPAPADDIERALTTVTQNPDFLQGVSFWLVTAA